MIFCQAIPQDYSDHSLTMWLVGGFIFILLIISSFFFGRFFSEHKEVVEYHKTTKEKREIESKEHKTLWDDYKHRSALHDVEEKRNTKFEENLATLTKEHTDMWNMYKKLEGNYRHIEKALNQFNEMTPIIQNDLVSMVEELKHEVRRVEELKMTIK